MKTDYPRVAQYMPPYPSLNGTAAFCRGLSRAMNRLQKGVCPIITWKNHPAHDNEVLLSYPKPGPFPFAVPAELKRDLQTNRHGLDGIVLHGTYNPPMVGLAKFLNKIGMPYLFIPHDPYPPSLRNHHRIRKALFWRLYEKPMIEGARALQLLNASHEKFLRDLGCQVPTFVLPNGCEEESLDLLPGNEPEPGSRREVRIQYLGRMDRNHKGLDLLISGFSQLNEPTAKLFFIGNEWLDQQDLERQVAALDLKERVHFLGRRIEPSIVLQSQADICVLTSRFDGFGLTIVEAMLAARPVLVSQEAGISSHVLKAGGGWVVPPSPEGIAKGLKQAMTERENWPEMGRRNRDYVLANLTWKKVAQESLEVYQDVFTRGL